MGEFERRILCDIREALKTQEVLGSTIFAFDEPEFVNAITHTIEEARREFPFEVGERTFRDKKTMGSDTPIGRWFVKWFGSSEEAEK